MEKILVTGGTGLLGYALQKIMPEGIFLGSGDYDLTQEPLVEEMFSRYLPDKVIHLAAKVGGIIDNIEHPVEFYEQNILINTFVIRQAYKHGVKKLVGLISNCSYPDKAATYPLEETELHHGAPAATNLAYGYAKRMLEVQINAYQKQYQCSYFCVIPASLYGPNDKFNQDSSHFIASLISKIYNAKLNGQKSIKLFGSGSALRQYLYANDLAKILLCLLDKYDGKETLNVASPDNLPVKAIAEIALKATGNTDMRLEFDPGKPDGQYRKDLSNQKLLKIIGDFQFTTLEKGLKETYNWLSKNAQSFQS